jgi:hypothetical protein
MKQLSNPLDPNSLLNKEIGETMKNIKVFLEIPEDYIDAESPILFASIEIKRQVERQLKDALVEQYLPNIKLPEIKIDPAEVKDRMLQILAERALDK